ncbi:MAG: divalent metal cation transporter [Chloroflexi bacterium]|nr:divalent metal cation transporter [Chloroflexota bacterium]
MLRRLPKFTIFTRIMVFLSVMGPGIITASVDQDAGGITTYSLAGARFGYSLLWILFVVPIVLFVVQETCARMGAITGKGLADLIRENYGVRVTFIMMAFLLVVDFGNTMANFAGLAAGGEIFAVPRLITVPIGAVAVWWLVVKGSYRFVEKVFLAASLMYATYVVSGFMASPPWGEVLQAVSRPSIRLEVDYLMMIIGLVGTTIAPWMQFYQQAATVEKGLSEDDYGYTMVDTSFGSVVTCLVSAFIIIACAATIYVNNIPIESAADAALALRPLAGQYASVLFALGLINASLFAASILPLSTAYSVCEALGFEAGVNKTLKQAPVFFGLYSFLIVASALVIMLPEAPLLEIMYFSQVANGILLPFILLFIIRLVNDRRLMGRYVNSLAFNVISWITIVALISFTAVLLVVQLASAFSPGLLPT